MVELQKNRCGPLEIPTLIKEIDFCVQTLNQTWNCYYRTEYENVIKRGRYQILNIIKKIKTQDSCQQPALSTKEELKRNIFHVELECEFEEIKIDHLRKEWTKQQENMAKLQESFFKKCRLLSLHGSYCSTQGSALCSILSILMERKDVVYTFLTNAEIYLMDFIKIADGCLFSFIRTYASDAPLEDSPDYKFILALWVSLSHISAIPDGRMCLIEREESQKALRSITYVLPRIQHSTANNLIIHLWKTLRNVSKEEKGKLFLQRFPELPETLNNYILRKYHPQIHTYTLETLEQISQNITNKEFLDQLMNLNGVQRLKELSGFMYPEVKHIPKKILNNVSMAAQHFLEKEKAQTPSPKCQAPCAPSNAATSRKISEPAVKGVTTRHKIIIPPDSGPTKIHLTQKIRPLGSQRDFGLKSESQQTGMSPLCATPCKKLFEQPSPETDQYGSFPHFGSAVCPVHRPKSSGKNSNLCTPTSSSSKSIFASSTNAGRTKKAFVSSSGSIKRGVRCCSSKSVTSLRDSSASEPLSRKKYAQKIIQSPSSYSNSHTRSTYVGPSRPTCLLPCHMPATFIGTKSAPYSSVKNVSVVLCSKLGKRPKSSPPDSLEISQERDSCQISLSDLPSYAYAKHKMSRSKSKDNKPSCIPVPASIRFRSREKDSSHSRLCRSSNSRKTDSNLASSSSPKRSAIPVSRKSRNSSRPSNETRIASLTTSKGSYKLDNIQTLSMFVGSRTSSTSDYEYKTSTSSFKRKFSPLDFKCIPHKKCQDESTTFSSRIGKQATVCHGTDESNKLDCFIVVKRKELQPLKPERPRTAPPIVQGGVYYYDQNDTDSIGNASLSSEADEKDKLPYTNSINEKRLVLWNPKKKTLACLDESDKRFSREARTMRVISRIHSKTDKKHQKIVTRIRIPNMNFNSVPFHPDF